MFYDLSKFKRYIYFQNIFLDKFSKQNDFMQHSSYVYAKLQWRQFKWNQVFELKQGAKFTQWKNIFVYEFMY